MRSLLIALLFCTGELFAQIAIFRQPGFPTVDAPEISNATLTEALRGRPVQTVEVEDLKTALPKIALLILPYGSAFPLDAWLEIREFVKRGGHLVVLGGAPFHQPVRRENGAWKLGVRQPTFAHELLIGPAEPVAVPQSARVAFPTQSWNLPVSGAGTVWELTVRLATRADMAGEHGSEGYRDAVLRPLVHLVDANGVPRACPLLEIDRLRGEGAGGRWIFATSDAPLDAGLIRAMVDRALEGATDFDARPVHASINPGESPVILLRATGFDLPDSVSIRVTDDAGREIHQFTAEAVSEVRLEASLRPGLHHVEVRAGDHSTTTGFWIRDDQLLGSGPKITVSRDWLRRDGKVFPVNGTTYMASDVHRQFLFEPDPHVWDRDFAQMSRLGINFVRTGIWTAWSRATGATGEVNESFLRALDAYVLTAAKHGIVVNFTFYAFLPAAHGGANPYLDPRSLEGQRQFLTTVARRYRGVNWIHYDLINEPSYAPPAGLWSNRPIRDEHERRAWRQWVRERHGDDVSLLRDRWQDRSWDPLELPWDHELWYSQIREDRRPRKVRDFVEFSQEAVAGWARQLRAWLREAGGDVLVTLGQDEGGTGLRSSQQIHGEFIDYTALHPWWQNDDLLSSGIMSRIPEKPMLFQESGLMRLEDASGWPVRSPDLAAHVLEAKYAYAFAARGGGVIEWAWNINPYMPIDNESVIGFIRPDGTAKPELDVVPEYAEFFRAATPWLDDFEPDQVVLVIPQVRLFMNRPAATDGFRRMVRVMAERFGVVPMAISDLRLTPERLRTAKLVIVPSVEFLDRSAATALRAASQNGVKVLFIGAISGDSYGEVSAALQEPGVIDAGRPVRFREQSRWGVATFDRNLRESLLRSNGEPSQWHEPLPLEHAREEEPLVGLLRETFAAAGVQTNPSDTRIAVRLLHAPRATFAVLVNETAQDAQRRITIAGRAIDVLVPAERSRLVLFNRSTGEIIAQK